MEDLYDTAAGYYNLKPKKKRKIMSVKVTLKTT